MASLNSLPFVIEARVENRVFLNSLCGSQLTTVSLKNPLDLGNVRSLSWGRKRVLWGNNKLVRAKSNESDDGKNDVNDDDNEAAFQAAFEKSKKLLAMHKELLKQIDETRKRMSSIKGRIIEPDDELFTPEVDIGTNQSASNIRWTP